MSYHHAVVGNTSCSGWSFCFQHRSYLNDYLRATDSFLTSLIIPCLIKSPPFFPVLSSIRNPKLAQSSTEPLPNNRHWCVGSHSTSTDINTADTVKQSSRCWSAFAGVAVGKAMRFELRKCRLRIVTTVSYLIRNNIIPQLVSPGFRGVVVITSA